MSNGKNLTAFADAAIERNEEMYRIMVANVSDIIALLDQDGIIRYESPSVKEILGYEEDELIGKHMFELFHPEDIGHVQAVFEKHLEIPGSTPAVVFRYLHKNGLYVYLESRGNNQLHNQAIRGIIVVSRDISERKRAEEDLRKSELKYRKLIEQATDAIFVADESGRFEVFNESCSKLTGYSAAELSRMSFFDFTVNEDLARQPFRFDELRKDKNIITERMMRNKAGEILDVEINARMLDDGRILVMARNITYRKNAAEEILKSNARFQIVSRATSDIVWDWNIDTGQVWHNDNYYKTLGQEKENELIKFDVCCSRVHPDDFERVKRGVDAALNSKEEIWRDEYRFLRSDGVYLHFFDRGYIIRDKKGKAIRMIGSMTDITDKKKAEEKLKSNFEQLLVLSKLSEAVSRAQRPEEIYELAVLSLRQTIKCDRSSVLLFDDNGVMQFVASSGLSRRYIKAASGHTPWLPAEKDPQPIFISDIEADPSLTALLSVIRQEGITALGFIPLVHQNKLLGKFMIYYNQKHQFSDEEIHLAKTIARDVAFAIGERKSEMILAESENRLRTILDTDPECIKLMDIDCRLIDINRAGLNMIEADSVELVRGASLLPVVSDNHMQAAEQLVKSVFEGKSGRLEFEMITLKGNRRWCEINLVPFRNAEGAIIYALGVTRDFTERKAAEKKLVKSKETLDSIMNSALDGIICVDKNEKIISWNPQAENIFGYKEINVVGKRLSELVIPETYRARHRRGFEMYRNTGSSPVFNKVLQVRALHASGHEFYVELIVRVIKTDGEEFLATFVRDITERKEAEEALKFNEEKYRTVIEQAVDAIALYDSAGKVLDVNTGAASLLGYSKEELTGMYLNEILTKEELLYNPVRYDVLQQGNSTVKQRKMIRKDGSIVETEVRSQQLPDGRFLSVIRDLTERIKAEMDLAASYDAVRKLTSHLQKIREEERTSIAREIHDELGQQLTVLKMDVSWLRKKINPADEGVKVKLKELTTMLDETVRTVRRIASELRPSLLDDLGLIAAIEWQLGEFKKRSGISTVFLYPENELVLSDEIKTALFRIFQESLTNVARHSQAKKVTVELSIEDGVLVLSVCDDGKGFDKQKITEKRTLGILGMQERIIMAGGRYDIKSLPGNGTEVVVKIPATDK